MVGWGWLEAVIDTGLTHDAVGSVARVAVGRYGLVVKTVCPDLVRASLPQEDISIRLELFDDQLIKTIHAGTALCQMKSVLAWGLV